MPYGCDSDGRLVDYTGWDDPVSAAHVASRETDSMSFQCPVHEVGWSYMGVCWMPDCQKVEAGPLRLSRPPAGSEMREQERWRVNHPAPPLDRSGPRPGGRDGSERVDV